MATYFVGDLQGCFDELQLLLEKVQFNPNKDRLYLVGDLVARGDKSLACLRFVKNLGASAQTVLGNHDLHLLATYAGLKKIKACDHVEEIFQAEDCAELMDWLRKQPLCVHLPEQNILMSHAGISPDWDLATTKNCAQEVEQILTSPNYVALLQSMYGEEPNRWQADLKGEERLRYIINAFTRMRFCYRNHALDFACKLPVNQAPSTLVPWFDLNNPLYQEVNIIFGHWASLIHCTTPKNIYALDTGCVWGNYLSLLRWEDKKIFTQQAIKTYQD